jgi:hypothetical protein
LPVTELDPKRPMPYRDPNRIMAAFGVTSKDRPSLVAHPNFDDFRDQRRSFQPIPKYVDGVASILGPSQPMHNRLRESRLTF